MLTMDLAAPVLDAWFTREEYELRASFHDLPASVIATKPDATFKDWIGGDGRSFSHNYWRLCTTDLTKKYHNVVFNCHFDVPVDYGGVRLSDDEALHDCLSKKLLCIAALTTGLGGKKVNAEGTVKLCGIFNNLVRWRRGIGLNRNSLLTAQHFDGYVALLAGEALDIVPVLDRLDRLVADVAAGRLTFPIKRATRSRAGGGCGKIRLSLDWHALAALLGVSMKSITYSGEFRAELIDRSQHLCPSQAEELAAVIARKRAPERGVRSAEALKTVLSVWTYLDHFSGSGWLDHDPIQFPPFKARPLDSIADQIGRAGERTTTIHPQSLLRLLDSAAKWALDYAPHILTAVEALEASKLSWKGKWQARLNASAALDVGLPAGMPKLWLGWLADSTLGTGDVPRLLLADAVAHLLTACAILIGAFGGRRVGEITSLRAGCIEEAKPGLYELTIYIEKTLQDLDRIPVPAMLKAVVGTLERLTARTRKATGEAWLFRVLRTSLKTPSYIDPMLSRRMAQFAKFEGLMAEDPGFAMLKPHQLRRAFAVVYYHGYLGASLDSLSRFLRHSDPEMTRIYINEILPGAMGRLREEIAARTGEALAAMGDEERQWLASAKSLLKDLEDRSATFDDVRCEAMTHRLLQMWDGTEAPIGRGAARLYADLDAMAASSATDVRVGPRSNDPDAMRLPFEASLKRYVAKHRLDPVPGHAAHCLCRPGNKTDLAEAECLKERAGHRRPWSPDTPPGTGSAPDHSFSGMYVCLRCAHCAAFSDNQQVIAAQERRLEDAVARGASPAAREGAAEKHARHKALVAAARGSIGDRARK